MNTALTTQPDTRFSPNEWITDGTRLVMVVRMHPDGTALVEDAADPTDDMAPVNLNAREVRRYMSVATWQEQQERKARRVA